MEVADNKNLNGQFEDELLSELEVDIIPYKKKGRIRLEIMNEDFCTFLIKKGIIESDMIDDITWNKAGKFINKMVEVAPEFYKENNDKKK